MRSLFSICFLLGLVSPAFCQQNIFATVNVSVQNSGTTTWTNGNLTFQIANFVNGTATNNPANPIAPLNLTIQAGGVYSTQITFQVITYGINGSIAVVTPHIGGSTILPWVQTWTNTGSTEIHSLVCYVNPRFGTATAWRNIKLVPVVASVRQPDGTTKRKIITFKVVR